jgi:hypothetical protein
MTMMIFLSSYLRAKQETRIYNTRITKQEPRFGKQILPFLPGGVLRFAVNQRYLII